MIDAAFLCIHNSNTDIFKLKENLEKISGSFKKTIILSHNPAQLFDLNYEIVVPFKENSFFFNIYSGIFFSGCKKNIFSNTKNIDIDTLQILYKNLHDGVDASMLVKNNEVQPLPGAYSDKIINKFKASSPDTIEDSFLKRLKINKIKS